MGRSADSRYDSRERSRGQNLILRPRQSPQGRRSSRSPEGRRDGRDRSRRHDSRPRRREPRESPTRRRDERDRRDERHDEKRDERRGERVELRPSRVERDSTNPKDPNSNPNSTKDNGRQTQTRTDGRRSKEPQRDQGADRADRAREARPAARSPARKPPADRSDRKEKDAGKKSGADGASEIKPIWTCKQCRTSMFGHLEECTKCHMTKPELDLRFVQVWNVPPDVAKKTLQWFQKKAGGASAELAPVGAQLVTAAEMQTAILEMKAIPEAEKMVAAIEKWKVGIPKMKAKVISQQDFENFLEKSKTHLVFVKNLPEDIEDEGDIKLMAKDIKKATIGTHPTHGRFAMIEATNHEAARACVDVFNIPHSGGVMTAELTTAYQQETVLKASKKGAGRRRNSRQRSRSKRR